MRTNMDKGNEISVHCIKHQEQIKLKIKQHTRGPRQGDKERKPRLGLQHAQSKKTEGKLARVRSRAQCNNTDTKQAKRLEL